MSSAHRERLAADVEKYKASYAAGVDKELQGDLKVSSYLLAKMKEAYRNVEEAFNEDSISSATSRVCTIAQQQARAKARGAMVMNGTEALSSMEELLNNHGLMSKCLASGGVADKLEMRVIRELSAMQSLLLDGAAQFGRLREELVRKCQACREEFHAEANDAMSNQMPRTLEIHSKISNGVRELSRQQGEERAEQDKMIDEELAQLQERTHKFLAANVEPSDPRFEQHLSRVNDAELRKKSLNESEDTLKPLQETCDKLSEKIQLSERVGEPNRKKRRLSTWVPLLGRLGGM